MAYELSWELRTVIVTYRGDVDIGDVLDAQREYGEDARFDTLKFVIIDTLDIASTKITADDFEKILVSDIGSHLTNRKLIKAFVANDPALIALAEKYQAYGDGYELRIFQTLADARSWIEAVREHPMRPGMTSSQ